MDTVPIIDSGLTCNYKSNSSSPGINDWVVYQATNIGMKISIWSFKKKKIIILNIFNKKVVQRLQVLVFIFKYYFCYFRWTKTQHIYS